MSKSVTICIPHWQVKPLLLPCLRSIRKYSQQYDVKVMVVDNGSADESLDYLRGLNWIELIERPDESPSNWPRNVFTAWDEGIRQCDTDYFITMHTDVFIKDDCWLEPFFQRIEESSSVAAVGAWKMSLGNSFYEWQKQFFSSFFDRIRGKKNRSVEALYGYFPRDYCAMYRVRPIVDHDLKFSAGGAGFGGGLPIMKQLWEQGYEHRMIPVPELSQHIVHIAHGSAAVAAELTLGRKRDMKKVEKRVANLFAEPWVKALYDETQWDR
jgi:glycosyltransferase involved in cell wall biosynthesis